MLAFIFSRILEAIPILLVVGFIAFALFAYVGDLLTIMPGQDYPKARHTRPGDVRVACHAVEEGRTT